MSHIYQGNCHCGHVSVEVVLPESIEHYSPRKCDCDFCMNRAICYLSHPASKITIKPLEDLEKQHQGSNQAAFLTCPKCKTVVAASCEFGEVLKGAVNASLLADFANFQTPTVASPKLLAAEDKYERWQALWVEIEH